ncbi:MAG: hypothetical protein WC694_00165 [Candidatus Paceibacterota bacterium]|jgi:type II secretory pathway pseudopilin PulG
MNYKLQIKKSKDAGRRVLSEAKGYTIIETMISVSLFVIIVTIAMGSLLNANLLHKKSQKMRSIIDNLSFIMEDMSRNLRTGYNYHCIDGGDPSLINTDVRSCSDINGGGGISFKSSLGDQWVYFIGTYGGKDGIFRSFDGGNTFIQLNSDEIEIDSISSFKVEGAELPPGDSQQPFVTIKLVGRIISDGVSSTFSLQTSVSQRRIDI